MKYTMFCNGHLSNWAFSPFELAGHKFHSLEQYLMWRKALLFADLRVAQLVLDCPHAAAAKILGRQVSGFDEIAWYCSAKRILFQGARFGKFEQHLPSRVALLDTAGTILVEASNSDPVWGIGLAEYDERALDIAEWRGTNWLGEVLTTVREALLADIEKTHASAR